MEKPGIERFSKSYLPFPMVQERQVTIYLFIHSDFSDIALTCNLPGLKVLQNFL